VALAADEISPSHHHTANASARTQSSCLFDDAEYDAEPPCACSSDRTEVIMRDDSSIGNDNERSRLDALVEDAIEDFVVRAERDIEGDEEPIEAAPALIELAAACMADVFRETEHLSLDDIIAMVTGRLTSMLMAEVERAELLDRPHLVV
jgi:hypothetical protein